MKKISLFFALTLAFLWSGNQAFAQTLYYGEFCWEVGQDDVVFNILQLAFSDMGDNHVQVSGRQIDDGLDDDKPELYNGNGEIVGDKVVFMLKVANDESEYDLFGSGKFYVSINLATLQGTFNGIVTLADRQSQETESVLGSGFFNVTACPN